MIFAMRDLRYYLIEGDAHFLDDFRILDSRQETWGESLVTFYVLCTSHAVTVELQGRRFTEVLSCRGPLDVASPLADLAAFKPFEIATNILGVRYRFQLTLEELSGNNSLSGAWGQNEISVNYPQMPGLDVPVTRIGWSIEPGALRLETLHTYPEEGSGVRSMSKFECSQGNRI